MAKGDGTMPGKLKSGARGNNANHKEYAAKGRTGSRGGASMARNPTDHRGPVKHRSGARGS